MARSSPPRRSSSGQAAAAAAAKPPAKRHARPTPHAKPKSPPKSKRPRAHAKRKHVHHLSPAARRARRLRREERLGQPLSVTPELGLRHYVFPVTGRADYSNAYGAFRGDVPGNWHHGDDIFAALGTPVVAVATGTLNRVGWQRLGGWRLWVRDSRRNEFYYAHLSGYSPLALHSRHVKAGDVIGFVGNTGDAFYTPPHVHFEVHPSQLLRLGYNGAVDPTGYLGRWRHLEHVRAPRPVHPAFPPGAVRQEASYVWRELLASRGLIRHAPSPQERPTITLPAGALDLESAGVRRASPAATPGGGGGAPIALPASLLAALAMAVAGVAVVRRRRPSAARAEIDDEPTVSGAVERLAGVARSLRARA